VTRHRVVPQRGVQGSESVQFHLPEELPVGGLVGLQGLLHDPVDGATVGLTELVCDLLVGPSLGQELHGLAAPPLGQGVVAAAAAPQAANVGNGKLGDGAGHAREDAAAGALCPVAQAAGRQRTGGIWQHDARADGFRQERRVTMSRGGPVGADGQPVRWARPANEPRYDSREVPVAQRRASSFCTNPWHGPSLATSQARYARLQPARRVKEAAIVGQVVERPAGESTWPRDGAA